MLTNMVHFTMGTSNKKQTKKNILEHWRDTDDIKYLFRLKFHFQHRRNNNNSETTKLGSIIFLEVLEEDARGSYTSLKGQWLNPERSRCQWSYSFCIARWQKIEKIQLLLHLCHWSLHRISFNKLEALNSSAFTKHKPAAHRKCVWGSMITVIMSLECYRISKWYHQAEKAALTHPDL